MHRQLLELVEDHGAEDQAGGADDQAEQQQAAAAHAEELDARQVGQDELRLIGPRGGRQGEEGKNGQKAAEDVLHECSAPVFLGGAK